jgi:biopolymer transport protein ExbD
MLCCAVFFLPKQFYLERGMFFIRFANASEKKTTSPFPSGMNLPIQGGRDRYLFSFYPQKQYVIAVNKKGELFLNGKHEKKEDVAKKVEKIYKASRRIHANSLSFLFDKDLTLRDLWPILDYLNSKNLFRHKKKKDFAAEFLMVQIIVEKPNSLLLPFVHYLEDGGLFYHWTRRVYFLLGNFKKEDRKTLKSGQRLPCHFMVRLEKNGLWLGCMGIFFKNGCNLKKSYAYKHDGEDILKKTPTCKNKEVFSCLRSCLASLKELFPDQDTALLYISPDARKTTTIQKLVELLAAFYDAKVINPILLLNPSFSLGELTYLEKKN